MLLSRTAAIVLRLSEFISAALVLGFSAWFLDQHHKYEVGPWGKEVYAITLASISVFLALLWLSTSTKRILNYPTDFILAAAWFAAFDILLDYSKDHQCGGVFDWRNISAFRGSWCGKWKAAIAFTFISGCLWLSSFVLGLLIYHKFPRKSVATNGTTRHARA